MRWKVGHIGLEGDAFKIAGLAVWKHDWRSMGESVDLPHPSYPSHVHRYGVYEIGEIDDGGVFAAGELSAGVWGFYVPA